MCIFGWFKKKKKKAEEINLTQEKKPSASVAEGKEPVRSAADEITAEIEAEKLTKSMAANKPKKVSSTPKEAVSEEVITDEREIEAIADSLESSDVTPPATRGKGRFEINRTKDGARYYFNIIASNKVGIATSQVYSSAQSAMIGVKSVIANAEKAPIEDTTLKKFDPVGYPKWEIYLDGGGKFRFKLSASNGSCVCHSQGYTTKANCKNGISSIIRTVKDYEIDKTYLRKD